MITSDELLFFLMNHDEHVIFGGKRKVHHMVNQFIILGDEPMVHHIIVIIHYYSFIRVLRSEAAGLAGELRALRLELLQADHNLFGLFSLLGILAC